MMVSLILWAKWIDRGHYLTWRYGCFGDVIYAQCCSPPLTDIRASSSWRGTARFPSQENALGKCSQALTKSGKGTPPCSLMLASFLTQSSFPHQETEKESADILQPALFLVLVWIVYTLPSPWLCFVSVSHDLALIHHHLPTLLPLSLATKARSAEGPTSTISWCIPSNCFLGNSASALPKRNFQ